MKNFDHNQFGVSIYFYFCIDNSSLNFPGPKRPWQ